MFLRASKCLAPGQGVTATKWFASTGHFTPVAVVERVALRSDVIEIGEIRRSIEIKL